MIAPTFRIAYHVPPATKSARPRRDANQPGDGRSFHTMNVPTSMRNQKLTTPAHDAPTGPYDGTSNAFMMAFTTMVAPMAVVFQCARCVAFRSDPIGKSRKIWRRTQGRIPRGATDPRN